MAALDFNDMRLFRNDEWLDLRLALAFPPFKPRHGHQHPQRNTTILPEDALK